MSLKGQIKVIDILAGCFSSTENTYRKSYMISQFTFLFELMTFNGQIKVTSV